MPETAPAVTPAAPAAQPVAAAPEAPPVAPEAATAPPAPPAEPARKAGEETARWVALQRQEVANRKAVEALKAREAEFAKQSESLAETRKTAELFAKLRESKNPLAVLEAFGLSPDDVGRAVIDRPVAETAEAIVERKLAERERAESAARAKAAEVESARVAQQIADTRAQAAKQIGEYVAANAERFPTVAAESDNGAVEAVYATMEGVYQRGILAADGVSYDVQPGTVLTFEAAAERVERTLEERVNARLLTIPKYRAKVAALGTEKPATLAAPQAPPKPPVTLTNAITPGTTVPAPAPKTAADRLDLAKRRAVAHITKQPIPEV